MSLLPTICPNCYRNIRAPELLPDGFLRCNGCGHAFPPVGDSPYSNVPPVRKPHPENTPQLFPVPGTPSYGGTSYSPVSSIPSAAGPQQRGNPGLIACGVVAGLGLMCAVCCGGLSFFAYSKAREIAELAELEVQPIPFPQPKPLEIPTFPTHEMPTFPPVEIPAFEIPPVGIPNTPPPDISGVVPKEPKTLDEILAAVETASPNDFASHQLLRTLNDLPVEEERRSEVVSALLKYLEMGNGLAAIHAKPALMKWASIAESNQLAQFAVTNGDLQTRRLMMEVLASVGGDATTAKTILPLFGDFSLSFSVKDALVKIGLEAEEPVLAYLESSSDTRTRHQAYDVLGAVGGEKSKDHLQQIIAKGEGFDRVFGTRAIRAIEQRENKSSGR